MSAGREREAARQRALLAVLLGRAGAHTLRSWLSRPDDALSRRGLRAYFANAGASAERALGTTFPLLKALVGEEGFGALARACWHDDPPSRGDLALFAEALPGFIERDPDLSEVGCLADCARLEWLLACCEAAPDVVPTPQSYSLLGEADPRQLRFALAPGLALLSSTCPVVSIWRAFRDGKLTPMREALASGSAENALVWRRGWKAEAVQLEPSTSAWFQLLMQGQPLGDALSAMGEDFAFEPWLLEALRQGWVLGVRRL